MGRDANHDETGERPGSWNASDTSVASSRMSSRIALRRMRDAYLHGQAGDLQRAYADLRWRTRGLRLLLSLVERAYPISGMIRFAGKLSRGIQADGLAKACRVAEQRLGLQIEVDLPEATRRVLPDQAVILYGNHPTLLTPFLIGGVVDRPDLRVFMASYVGRLIPSLSAYMFPIEASSPRRWTEWRRGGTRRIIAHSLTETLEKGREREEAKPSNARMLAQGIDHLKTGGCVVIFPGGGGRGARHWYPGIGVLANAAFGEGMGSEVYLVPVREENSSKKHVYYSLRHGGGPMRSKVFLKLPPIHLRFGEPVLVEKILRAGESPRQSAARLQHQYEQALPRKG